MNSVPHCTRAQAQTKEPAVADPSTSDPKPLKLQLRQDTQLISLVLTVPNSSCWVSCSFETTAARTTQAWEQDGQSLAQDRQKEPVQRGMNPP